MVRDDGSSSPSVKLIVSIRKTKGVVPAFLVEASDDSSFFCPQSLFKTLEFSSVLFKGNEIEDAQWVWFQEQSEQTFAYLQSIRLLTRREHTYQELEQKLLVRGYSKASIQVALGRAETEGYISHDRFADQWLHQRVRSYPESLGRIQARLQAKGLSRSDAATALTSFCEDHGITEEYLCERALGKIPHHYELERKIKKLQNLGFSYGLVSRLVRKSEES